MPPAKRLTQNHNPIPLIHLCDLQTITNSFRLEIHFAAVYIGATHDLQGKEWGMERAVNWGVLGTGNIAKQFARGLKVLPEAHLVAVGSRAQETADAFGDEFEIPRSHASYEALVSDPDVEVIYVSTPHQLHRENTLLCLSAGKAVLCEKPFAINAVEAADMVAAARQYQCFLMEAMWTRFLPVAVKAREWLHAGEIGEPRMLTADFGFRAEINREGRLFNPEYGGGALLDVGVYTVSLASMVFGEAPQRTAGFAHIGETGVDEQAAFVLGYTDGRLASLTCAVRVNTPQDAVIMGTEGSIRFHAPFWRSTGVTLKTEGKDDVTFTTPHKGNGYEYQAAEVMNCLRAAKLESQVMPLDESVAIMQTMDQIRGQWNLKYPME